MQQKNSPASVPDSTGSTLDLGGDVSGTPAAAPVVDTSASADQNTAESSIDPITQWANAIMHFEGGNPWNLNMRNNNPGNLKVTGYAGQVGTDSQGFAIFDSVQSGMDALIADLQAAVRKYPNYSLVQFETHYLGGNPLDVPAEGQPVVVNGKVQGNPWDYANYIAKRIGVSASDTLSSIFGG
ncbi:MAG TPA: hypothetical protein VKW06_07890 [Candidatus Angelobacter sp.]|nr:hypothetical protein [Candidatus Angelobacter sp.]